MMSNQSGNTLKLRDEYPPSKLWAIPSLAAYCETSRDTIERLIREGKLVTVMLRGQRRVTHESFVNYLKSQLI